MNDAQYWQPGTTFTATTDNAPTGPAQYTFTGFQDAAKTIMTAEDASRQQHTLTDYQNLIDPAQPITAPAAAEIAAVPGAAHPTQRQHGGQASYLAKQSGLQLGPDGKPISDTGREINVGGQLVGVAGMEAGRQVADMSNRAAQHGVLKRPLGALAGAIPGVGRDLAGWVGGKEHKKNPNTVFQTRSQGPQTGATGGGQVFNR